MELLNKVKKELENNKQYDFSSEFWTDELLSVLFDVVYATEKVVNEKSKKNHSIENHSLSMMDLSMAFDAGKRRANYQTRVAIIKAFFSSDTPLLKEEKDYEEWVENKYFNKKN